MFRRGFIIEQVGRTKEEPLSYVERVIEQVKQKDPNEPEFIQAVTEVLESLEPVIEAHPEYEQAKLLERIVEP